jgi:hypothetical protein
VANRRDQGGERPDSQEQKTKSGQGHWRSSFLITALYIVKVESKLKRRASFPAGFPLLAKTMHGHDNTTMA